MLKNKTSRYIAAGVMMALVVFGIDLITPLGSSDSVFYIGILLFSLWSDEKSTTVILCLVIIVLIFLGYFLSPPIPEKLPGYIPAANRIITLIVVGLYTLMVVKNKDLQQKNTSRALLLEKANREMGTKVRELAEANKELEIFTYISSHDLQEPLRKLRSFSTILLKNEKEKLSAEGRYYLNRLKDTATQMQGLIEDLLAYSKIKCGTCTFEKIPLEKEIEGAIEGLKNVIEEKKAVVKQEGNCEVAVIRPQIQNLLKNLIENSLKFSHSGRTPQIMIKCEALPGSRLNYPNILQEAQYCHITVSDNGIGFPPQYKDRIFEVFERLNESDRYPGSGIGLALCKRIAENHKGIITANGEPDKGAQFDLYFPVNNNEANMNIAAHSGFH